MSGSGLTPNIQLPVFTADDKPTWLGDVNDASAKIDAQFGVITGLINALTTQNNNNTAALTTVTTLQTTVTALQGTVTTLQASVTAAALESDLTALAARVTALAQATGHVGI